MDLASFKNCSILPPALERKLSTRFDILLTMWTLLIVLTAALTVFTSCGPEPKPAVAESPKKADNPKIFDEYRRFPKANLIDTKIVQKELLDKPFMPGGTLARYKKGKTEYQMFLAQLPSADQAAFLLLDWQKALKGAHLLPSFGGYFGEDAGRNVFVFSKGRWIAGVVGLPKKEADAQARLLAGQIQ